MVFDAQFPWIEGLIQPAGYFHGHDEFLVLQIPFQEVVKPVKPAQNTLSEGSWRTRESSK